MGLGIQGSRRHWAAAPPAWARGRGYAVHRIHFDLAGARHLQLSSATRLAYRPPLRELCRKAYCVQNLLHLACTHMPPRRALPPLLQLLLTLIYTDGTTKYTFAMLLPGFFVAVLILGLDEVAR